MGGVTSRPPQQAYPTRLRRFAVGVLNGYGRAKTRIAEKMRSLYRNTRRIFDYLRMIKNSSRNSELFVSPSQLEQIHRVLDKSEIGEQIEILYNRYPLSAIRYPLSAAYFRQLG